MCAGRVARDGRRDNDLSRVDVRGRVRSVARTGAPGGRVTDGLVLLAAWLEFLALLAVLGYLLLRRGR
jgi:hypothetical protein